MSLVREFILQNNYFTNDIFKYYFGYI